MPGRIYSRDELLEAREAQPNVLHWEQFSDMFASAHRQGEHIAIVGPTGSGKTVLGLELCKTIGARKGEDRRPSRVVVLQYKPRDDTLRKILPEDQWPVIKHWPPSFGQEHCIVWVRGGPPSKAAAEQRKVFRPLLDAIYVEGGQTVYIPEAAHMERPIPHGPGLQGSMEEFWSSARSNYLTLISDTQRPRQVTRLMWSEPAWIMIFAVDDEDDLKRVAEVSGRKLEIYKFVPNLGSHEFVCVRRQKHGGAREVYVSRVDVTRDNRDNRNGKQR